MSDARPQNPLRRLWKWVIALFAANGAVSPIEAPTARASTQPEQTAKTEAASAPARPKPAGASSEQRARLRDIARARRAIADDAADFLDRIARLDLSHSNRNVPTQYQKDALNDLLGCDFLLLDLDDAIADLIADRNEFIDPDGLEKELAEACWPIDEAYLYRYEDDDSLNLERIYTVTPAEVRGRVATILPKMVRNSFAGIDANGEWSAGHAIFGLVGNTWKPLARTPSQRSWSREEIELFKSHISLAPSLALSRRYRWHVGIGAQREGPRILLPTSPHGCLIFFRNRERDNLSRRAALRHWVRHHYRETDITGLSYVRDHLRGQTEFRWSNLECEILVSQFDLEKNEAFKREAEQWRARRQHNRVRVRLKRHAISVR